MIKSSDNIQRVSTGLPSYPLEKTPAATGQDIKPKPLTETQQQAIVKQVLAAAPNIKLPQPQPPGPVEDAARTAADAVKAAADAVKTAVGGLFGD